MIYPLSSKIIPSLFQVGGKAKALIETTQAGFNVPEGFVLAVEFFQPWTDQIKSCDLWRAFLQAPGRETCAALQERARHFCFTFEQHATIESQLAQMPSEAIYAVRSSSPAEDLAQASFAGQYETILGVRRSDLERNIAETFSSMLDFRVVEYKRHNNLPVDNPHIAIIVQKQIRSELSGIAFSLNPNNNAFDEAMINASFGLGEAIVSGQVTPDTYVVDKVKKAILEKKIVHKSIGIWLKENGGTVEKPNLTPEAQALTDEQILEVAALAEKCEVNYGKPMDIEWAIEDGRLYLLQSRPITTYNPLFPEMITRPGERKNLYMDMNIMMQGFFDPVSELGLDIWSRMLPAATGGIFPRGFDGVFFDVGGREYVHMSNFAHGMKDDFRSFASYDLEIREVFKSLNFDHEYKALIKTKKMKKIAWAALPMIFRMIPSMFRGVINPDKATRECQQSLEAAYCFYKRDLLDVGPFGEIVKRGVAEYARLIFNMMGVLLPRQLARNYLEKLFRDQSVDEAVGLLSAASPTNPTAQMGRKMFELASFAELQDTPTEAEFVQKVANGGYSQAFMRAYTDYMERFGARGFKEIDIAVPRATENPGAFFRQLKALNIQQNNENALKERKRAAYQQLLELAKLRGEEKQFVSNAQRYMTQLGFRESPKYMFVVMIGELRKRALELGRQFVSQGRLDSPEQVFDLTVDQVSQAETDPGLDLQSLREKNLAPRRTVAHIKDWPKIVDSRGKIYRYIRPSETGDLAGEAISPGVVRGKAKVLASPYEKPLEKGEILVTRATEPAWTPVFMNAAGVVLEVGGQLQHGAIIAREYNLPCVSGIHDVTRLIKDGDLLEVDGTAGTVHLQPRKVSVSPAGNLEAKEWNDSLEGDFLWTNANYGEAVPDVMTPCTWSIVQITLDNADSTIGRRRPYGNIGGRLYANLSATASVAAIFGFGPKRFADMVEEGFGRLPEGVDIPVHRIPLWDFMRSAPPKMITKISRMQKCLKELPVFLSSSPDRCESLRARIESTSEPHELAALWEIEISPFYLHSCHMLEAAANQGGAGILLLRLKLNKLMGPEDTNALLTSSSGARGPLSSLEPLLGLSKLANGTLDRADYARRYGHRGPHEAELSLPRPGEDPEWIDRQLAGLSRSPNGVAAQIANQEEARQTALVRLYQRFPRKEKAILRQIDGWSRIAHEREAVRSELVRSFWVLRAFVLRAGVLSGQDDHIFFLSIAEILALLRGEQASLPKIPSRRAAYERYCALPPYPGVIRGRFDPFRWAADPDRRSGLFDAMAPRRAVASGALTGFPGAKGIVEGTVRVIASAEEGDQLQPGEVLVTTLTNVGWTPLFPRAAAVVTDVGAPLSHAAIVARELGIPAVVGCGNATQLLKTGDHVRVDGAQGTVEILCR